MNISEVEWESWGSRNLGHEMRWHTEGWRRMEKSKWTNEPWPLFHLIPSPPCPLFTAGGGPCVCLCGLIWRVWWLLFDPVAPNVFVVRLWGGSSRCWVISWENIRSNRPIAVRLSWQCGCRRAGFFRFQSNLLSKRGVNEWTSTVSVLTYILSLLKSPTFTQTTQIWSICRPFFDEALNMLLNVFLFVKISNLVLIFS